MAQRVSFVMAGEMPFPEVERFNRHVTPFLMTDADIKAWAEDRETSIVRAMLAAGQEYGSRDAMIGMLLFRVYPHHLEILSVGVVEEFRRQGIAKGMLYKLFLDPRAGSFPAVSARVPDNCDVGISWLKAMQFRAVRMLRPPSGSGPEVRDRYLFTRLRKQEKRASKGSDKLSAGDSSGGWDPWWKRSIGGG